MVVLKVFKVEDCRQCAFFSNRNANQGHLGYHLLLAADDMPDDCRWLRTRLEMEGARLENWSAASGLLELDDGDDLPRNLQASKALIYTLLTEIRYCMKHLAKTQGKYVELQPETQNAEKDFTAMGLIAAMDQTSLSSHQNLDPAKKWKVKDRLNRATKALTQPKRLKWVALDAERFEKELTRLRELNDGLERLLSDNQARKLEDFLEKIYLGMVQTRATCEALGQLATAAILGQAPASDRTSNAAGRPRNEHVLASLASFKIICARSNEPYDGLPVPKINHSQIQYAGVRSSDSSSSFAQITRTRTLGRYASGENACQVWVEWKTYKFQYSKRGKRDIPIKENTRRVGELVTMLQSEKPDDFLTPHCLGYFDDRDDNVQSERPYRFGLVFEIPDNMRRIPTEESNHSMRPVSLHQRITSGGKPSLTERMALAYKVTKCILYLHTVAWLHKALRSDSILFFAADKDDMSLEHPYLTGYEYARPDKDGETSRSTDGDENKWWQLYVHPEYQGWSGKGQYRKTYDIYSLGIILLEIAYWKPIHEIMSIDPDGASPEQIRDIRTRLLRPENDYLSKLQEDHGNKLYEAVKSCIDGRSAFGIGEHENEMSPQTGLRLQHEFTTRVVEGLANIRV